MQNYINQLVSDLEEVAQNPPKLNYIVFPSYMEEKSEVAKLALAPYKSIEELTGIKQEAFPDYSLLIGGQWEAVNTSIFKVFTAINIHYFDAPIIIPPEWLYEVITAHWQHSIKYMPRLGMDLILCTKYPPTCPYGQYCFCGKDYDTYSLPEKFSLKIIEEIIEDILKDDICLINPETIEFESAIKAPINPGNNALISKNRKEWIAFYPLKENEWLEIIERYIKGIKDEILIEDVTNVLKSKDPVKNFKLLIANSDESDNWLFHQTYWLKDRVRGTIDNHLNKNTTPFPNNAAPF